MPSPSSRNKALAIVAKYYRETGRTVYPVPLPEIRLCSQQLNITEKQITKFFDPFHFCLISLLCRIDFFWDYCFFNLQFGQNIWNKAQKSSKIRQD